MLRKEERLRATFRHQIIENIDATQAKAHRWVSGDFVLRRLHEASISCATPLLHMNLIESTGLLQEITTMLSYLVGKASFARGDEAHI